MMAPTGRASFITPWGLHTSQWPLQQPLLQTQLPSFTVSALLVDEAVFSVSQNIPHS